MPISSPCTASCNLLIVHLVDLAYVHAFALQSLVMRADASLSMATTFRSAGGARVSQNQRSKKSTRVGSGHECCPEFKRMVAPTSEQRLDLLSLNQT